MEQLCGGDVGIVSPSGCVTRNILDAACLAFDICVRSEVFPLSVLQAHQAKRVRQAKCESFAVHPYSTVNQLGVHTFPARTVNFYKCPIPGNVLYAFASAIQNDSNPFRCAAAAVADDACARATNRTLHGL